LYSDQLSFLLKLITLQNSTNLSLLKPMANCFSVAQNQTKVSINPKIPKNTSNLGQLSHLTLNT